MVAGYRPIHAHWLNAALGPHFVLETLLSVRGLDHPVCINRLVHAHSSAQGPVDRTAYLEHLKRSAERYQSIESKNEQLLNQGQLPLLERLTRKRLITLLTEMNRYLEEYELDLTLAMIGDAQKWETLSHAIVRN